MESNRSNGNVLRCAFCSIGGDPRAKHYVDVYPNVLIHVDPRVADKVFMSHFTRDGHKDSIVLSLNSTIEPKPEGKPHTCGSTCFGNCDPNRHPAYLEGTKLIFHFGGDSTWAQMFPKDGYTRP